MKINRKTVLTTAAVLGVVALAAGGTMAYFTDHETKTNEFTIGSVDVTLYESQLHRVNANVGVYFNSDEASAQAGNYHLCVPYTYQGAPYVNPYCTPNIAVSTDLSGVSAWQNGHVRAQNVAGQQGSSQRGVFSDEQIRTDATGTAIAATATNPGNYAGYVAAEYQNLVPGQQVRKFVYVQNDGNSDAYVRVKVTIPANVANLVTVKAPHTPQEPSTPAGNMNIDGVELGAYLTETDTTNDAGDKIMTFVYTSPLKPNEMTYWSPITTVKINDNVKESDFVGLANNGFGITVDADAIQAGGFSTAAEAFAAYDAQNS